MTAEQIGLYQAVLDEEPHVSQVRFITTLAGMMLFRGLNQFIGDSNTVPVPQELQTLGGGYLPEWGPNTGLNNSTLLLASLGLVGCSLLALWASTSDDVARQTLLAHIEGERSEFVLTTPERFATEEFRATLRQTAIDLHIVL